MTYMPAYCDPNNTVTGALYDSKISTTEIAKRFRKQVSQGKKGKGVGQDIPKDVKLSVKTQYFAGGSSINVNIKEIPRSWSLFNADFIKTEKDEYGRPLNYRGEMWSPEVLGLLELLQGMLNSFNRQNIDAMSDYFDVNFYGFVGVDWELEKEEREFLSQTILAFQS